MRAEYNLKIREEKYKWFSRPALHLSVLLMASAAYAEKKYDVGATETETKIDNTTPYRGPISVSAVNARTRTAYFKMINENGGINGRKINYISYGDACSPPKTVEQVRKFVESDEVLFTFSMTDLAPNLAARKYLKFKGCAADFVDSRHFGHGRSGELSCSTRGFWDPAFAGSDLTFAGWTKKRSGRPVIAVSSVTLANDFTSEMGQGAR